MLASFEKTADHLFDAAYFGQKDSVCGEFHTGGEEGGMEGWRRIKEEMEGGVGSRRDEQMERCLDGEEDGGIDGEMANRSSVFVCAGLCRWISAE